MMSEPTKHRKSKINESLFSRPAGVLLDQKQWFYLRNRYHLTNRELQVAILICRGFNNEEIGKALNIKHGTVKTYLRNIYRRVRVKNKVTLLLRFIEDIKEFYVPSQLKTPPIPIVEKAPKPGPASRKPQRSKPARH